MYIINERVITYKYVCEVNKTSATAHWARAGASPSVVGVNGKIKCYCLVETLSGSRFIKDLLEMNRR